MPLNEKKIVEEENNKAIARFKLNKDESDILIYPLSPWANRLFSHQPHHYRKKVIPLNNDSHLAFIKKNKTPEGFVWHTNAQGAHRAVLYGLVQPEALSASVLSTLGQYHASILKRAYQRHTLSDLTESKLSLLEFGQSLIETSQELERLLNTYQRHKQSCDNLARLETGLYRYADELKGLNKIRERLPRHIQAQAKDVLLSKQQNVQVFLEKIKKSEPTEAIVKKRFQADGRGSLGLFLKIDLLKSVRSLQLLNQTITNHPRAHAFYRGDFHTFCVDALKVINDHQADLHNPVLKAHQGLFEKGSPLVFDFSGEEHQKKLMAHRLMCISHIERKDRLVHRADDKMVLRPHRNKQDILLKTTPYIKWSHHFGFLFNINRTIAFVWNTLIGLTFGLSIDLFVGLLTGLFGIRFRSIAQLLRINFSPTMENKSFFSLLCKELPNDQYSLGTLVGFKMGNFFKNVFVDFFYGVHASVGQYKVELWDNLISDYKIGHQTKPNLEKSASLYFQQLRATQKQRARLLKKALTDKYPNRQRCDLKREGQPKARFARAPYQLSDGEWLDLLNALSRGTKLVADTFSHALFSQNPLTGLIFSHVYALGALAVFAPEKVAFLPKAYIQLSQSIAEAMSRGHLTSSLANASFQGQIVASLTEAAKNGQDSWLSNASLLFEKEPADILVYATLAVGLGALLAYEVEIPILSQEIRNNMGTFPLPSLGVAGGKIGVLLFDFLEAKKSPTKSQNLSHLQELLEKELTSHQLNQQVLLQIALLLSFCEHQSLSDGLPFLTRRWLLASIRSVGNLNESELDTLKGLLFPSADHSIFFVTVTTILNYVPLLLRCTSMPITQNKEPWLDLKNKVKKDLTRVVHALSSLSHTISSNLKALTSAMLDLLGNETLAKIEVTLTGTNSIAKAMHQLNTELDGQFEQSQARIKHYSHPLYREVTAPTPFKLLSSLLSPKDNTKNQGQDARLSTRAPQSLP
jgi:hypothetical protein